jgi:hypothetical protein
MALLQIDIITDSANLLVSDIALRLLINLVSVYILIRGIYFKTYDRADLFFTFFSFNIIIFFISFLLNKVDLSIGAAFGLFAVFSMLRYRTENISIKDMSYLFLVIAIGLISAITKLKGLGCGAEYLLLVGISASILVMAFLLENNKLIKKENAHMVVYDNLELIKPEKRKELIEDIKAKTGIAPHKISIEHVNISKNTCEIKIFYYED